MADKTISALTSATTPLAGTEVLPIVQSSTTVKVSVANLTVGQDVALKTVTATVAATQDGVTLAGRSGGTGSYIATITPTTLSASRTVTLPDANTSIPVATQILTYSGPTAARTITLPDANFTAARIDAAQSFTGDQTLSTGNIIQGTAAKGINFTANTPAAGKTSQLLNWYEEGTWTPTLTSTSGGAPTYTTQTGLYTRNGRQVSFYFQLTLATIGTMSTSGAQVYVPTASLPFTPSSNFFFAVMQYSGLTSSYYSANALYTNGYGYLFYGQAAASTGSGGAMTVGNISGTSTFRITGTYFI
jgi:hypothetical protein